MNEKICDKVPKVRKKVEKNRAYLDLEFHEFLIVSFSQFEIKT